MELFTAINVRMKGKGKSGRNKFLVARGNVLFAEKMKEKILICHHNSTEQVFGSSIFPIGDPASPQVF